ncbi:MAG: MBOAT family protein [Mogibacterium sp.]|nr:MBOAT family protein [Mogibacterium sp.]
MLFSSIFFLFYFLPATLAVYYLVPRRFLGVRNAAALIASLIFYSWGEPNYVFLMIYSAAFNYFMARQIRSEQDRGGTGRRNLVFTVIVNLFILGFFKYFGFLMDTVSHITHVNIQYTALALPIGISFYTFQAMSYIIDVYWRRVEPQRRFLRFALYLSLFPQLIAGPIVRYRDVADQLEHRDFTLAGFGAGAERFIFGLGKKVLLANNFGALYQTVTGLGSSRVSVLTYWVGIIAYTLQIYYDFSGYSDMAIGLGKMLGFDFNENFNYPYVAKSVTEFWRRWHMSLSSWFREYVYIPLGGSRVSAPRHIMNLLIVWALTGLWHGASWNFVVWGLYYGVVLIIEKYVIGKGLARAPGAVQRFYTLFVVVLGWVIFSITDLGAAWRYLGILFGAGNFPLADMTTAYLLRTHVTLLLFGIVLAGPTPHRTFEAFSRNRRLPALILLFTVFILSVSYLVYGSYNPFLYFRF